MSKQRTLRSGFTLQGKGLHSGMDISITFNPAPENHGYKIVRTDIPGSPVIDAVAENVAFTERCTMLSRGDIQVATIEHAMAALYASRIDNCLMEVNAPEFPILDGSSELYIRKIREVGVQSQQAEREYLSFDEIVEVNDPKTGSSLILLPNDHFELQVKIAFNSLILDEQYAKLTDLREFAVDTASARTFVFVREIKDLLQKGLIKGGDLDNAIVIYDSVLPQDEYDQLADALGVERKDATQLGYIMHKPLQFDNEPARHKLLDVIGDIALTGRFIKGKIIATCPGHKINNLFARAIRERSFCTQPESMYAVNTMRK